MEVMIGDLELRGVEGIVLLERGRVYDVVCRFEMFLDGVIRYDAYYYCFATN